MRKAKVLSFPRKRSRDLETRVLASSSDRDLDSTDSCHGRVIRNQQKLFPIFLLLL